MEKRKISKDILDGGYFMIGTLVGAIMIALAAIIYAETPGLLVLTCWAIASYGAVRLYLKARGLSGGIQCHIEHDYFIEAVILLWAGMILLSISGIIYHDARLAESYWIYVCYGGFIAMRARPAYAYVKCEILHR